MLKPSCLKLRRTSKFTKRPNKSSKNNWWSLHGASLMREYSHYVRLKAPSSTAWILLNSRISWMRILSTLLLTINWGSKDRSSKEYVSSLAMFTVKTSIRKTSPSISTVKYSSWLTYSYRIMDRRLLMFYWRNLVNTGAWSRANTSFFTLMRITSLRWWITTRVTAK